MFEINSSNDKLNLLKEDFKSLIQNRLNVSLAEKTISDSWHLSEWVFEEFFKNINSKEEFRTNLYKECPELKMAHDVANISKHKSLSRPKVHIQKTEKIKGAFSSAFSSGLYVSRLEIHYDEGKISIETLVAINYWETTLSKLKNQ
jgi:hypothetical protein